MGYGAYPEATTLFITTDAGGSNGYRSRAWKHELRVRAELDVGEYPMGVTVTKEQMEALALVPDAFHGEWNYKLLPRSS